MPQARSNQVQLMAKRGYIPAMDAARRIGRHVTTIYELLKNDKLGGLKVGGSWYVQFGSLIDYLGPDAARALGLTK